MSTKFDSDPFEHFYSSPLGRCLQTASAIAGGQGLEINVDARLRELDFGVFEGLIFSEAQSRFPDQLEQWLGDYDQPPEGGERVTGLGERVGDFLDVLHKLESGGSAVIVSHGGVIREVLRHLLGLPPELHWAFEITVASFSQVALSGENVRLVCLNDTSHLMKTHK